MFNIGQKKVDLDLTFLTPGVDMLSNLNYFPVPMVRNLTQKLQKNSNAALLPVPAPLPTNLSI